MRGPKTALLLICLLPAMSVSAAGSITQTYCAKVDTMAAFAMELRQAGKPLAESYRAAAADPHGFSDLDLVNSIVDSAYAAPLFETQKEKEKAVLYFRDEYFKQCQLAIKGRKG